MENAVEEHNGAVACEGGRQQQQPLYVKTKTQNVYSYLINTRFVCVSSRMYLHGMLFLVYNSLIRHIIVHLFMHIQHTHMLILFTEQILQMLHSRPCGNLSRQTSFMLSFCVLVSCDISQCCSSHFGVFHSSFLSVFG